MRVLVAEDEPRVADAVARGLRREGLAVDVAPDGATALYKARVTPYDVVVLDRDLPEVHGDDGGTAGGTPSQPTPFIQDEGGQDRSRPDREDCPEKDGGGAEQSSSTEAPSI